MLPEQPARTSEPSNQRFEGSPSNLPGIEFGLTGFHITKRALIIVLICVTLSQVFLRTGILTFVFLAPLGFAVLSSSSFLFTFVSAAVVNFTIYIITAAAQSGESLSFSSIIIDISYLTVLLFLFTWVTGGRKIRTAFRIIIASSISTIFFIIMINRLDSFFPPFLWK